MLAYGGPPGHWFRMPVFAHTNPVYVSLEGRPLDPGEAPALFLDQIDYLKDYVEISASIQMSRRTEGFASDRRGCRHLSLSFQALTSTQSW